MDDVDGKGKPEPGIYFEAARRLGVPKDQCKSCLVFEDTWTGVQVQARIIMTMVYPFTRLPAPLWDYSLLYCVGSIEGWYEGCLDDQALLA